MTKIKSNIWKMTVMFVANKRPYMTFLTIFLLTMPNATAQTIGLLTLVGQIIGFLFEIPSGYLSDKIGHKNALIIARTSMFFSTACYVFANNIYWFFGGAILLAIGTSFISGTSAAFIHETLVSLGKDGRYAEIMGKMRSIGFAIPIVLILVLPIIAETSFRWAFSLMLIIDLIGLLMALSLVNPSTREKIKEVDLKNFSIILVGFFKTKWAKYVLLTAIAFGLAFGATAGFKNPYQEMLGFSLTMLGILWATSRVFISLLLLINGKIHRLLTFNQFITLQILIYALSFIGIGLISNMWIVACIFILTTTTMFGFGAARSQYDLEFIGKSDSRATLLSIKAFMNNVFAGLVGVGMGALVVAQSYPVAYLVTGICLFIVVFSSLIILKRQNI